MINMIWAMDEDWLVGCNDKIPWHIKEDLLYYKEKTKGKTVLMGDKTYFSLKKYYKEKPLPYSKIYVASIELNNLDDAIVIKDLKTFLSNLEEDIFVVGGATIYNICLPYADRLYISFIKGHHEGNIYFKKFDLNLFNLVSEINTDKVRYTIYDRR